MSKKANAAFLTHVGVYLFVGAVLLIFTGLFQYQTPSFVLLETAPPEVDIDQFFNTYLRTPVTFEGKEQAIANLIVRYALYEESREPIRTFLDEHTEKYMNEHFPALLWRLEPDIVGATVQDTLIASGQTPDGTGPTLVKDFSSACVKLPHPHAGQPIKIQFSAINQNQPNKQRFGSRTTFVC